MIACVLETPYRRNSVVSIMIRNNFTMVMKGEAETGRGDRTDIGHCSKRPNTTRSLLSVLMQALTEVWRSEVGEFAHVVNPKLAPLKPR